jgi:hypothetical protein
VENSNFLTKWCSSKISTAMRFELTHPEDNNLAGYRLNHSATLSVYVLIVANSL